MIDKLQEPSSADQQGRLAGSPLPLEHQGDDAEQPVVVGGNRTDANGNVETQAKRRDQTKLRVVLPANQKTLVTPTILPLDTPGCATPTQLLSSLVHLNGHFTGLPGCTPTSADQLPVTGGLATMNPFFWGVPFGATNQPAEQVQPNQGVGCSATAVATDEAIRRRQQQQQAAASVQSKSTTEGLQFILSPLSFLLSPDQQDSWRRLGTAAAGTTTSTTTQTTPTGGGPGYSSQHQSPTSTNDLAANAATFRQGHSHLSSPLTQSLRIGGLQQQVGNKRAQLISSSSASSSTLSSPLSSSSHRDDNQHQHQTTSQLHNHNVRLDITSNEAEKLSAGEMAISQSLASRTRSDQGHADLLRTAHNQSLFPISVASQLVLPPPTLAQQKPAYSGQSTLGATQTHLQLLDSQPVVSDYQQAQKNTRPAVANMGQTLRPAHLLCPKSSYGQGHSPSRPLSPPPSSTFAALHYDGAGQPTIGVYDQHLRHLYLVQQQHQQQFLYQQPQAPTFMAHHLPSAPIATPIPHSNVPESHIQQSLMMPAGGQQHFQFNYDRNTIISLPPARQIRHPTLNVPPPAALYTNSTLMAVPPPPLPPVSSSCPRVIDCEHLQQETRSQVAEVVVASTIKNTETFGPSTSTAITTTTSTTTTSTTTKTASNSSSAYTESSTKSSQVREPLIVPCGSIAICSPPCNKKVNSNLDAHKSDLSNSNTTTKDLFTDCLRRAELINKSDNKTARLSPNKQMLKEKPPDGSKATTTEIVKKKSKGGRKKKQVTHEELIARKNRCKERNRVAAKRCRQKRKQFLDELHGRIDSLNDSNRKLQRENINLMSELEILKRHHKNCKIIVNK